jgi:histone H1/5
MEIIIGLVILGGVAWFFFMRDKKTEVSATDKVEEPANVTAPYKVPEPAATTPIPLEVEILPAGTEASIAAPAKAPAKPKAAAKPKAVAKAPAKAPAKAKASAKPKVTIAK